MGTIAYMSPEQARGEELDARTDSFSFGAVLYEMATGRMAFPGKSTAVIYEAILNRTLVPASQINQTLPPKLDEIIAKALEKDRKLRYQSAAEIRTDLQRQKRDSDSARLPTASGRVADMGEQLGVPWKVVVPVGFAVVALAAVSYFYFHSTPKLTDKDTIVLADFANTTGDPVFDGTLRQGLAVQLEQSPFLSIVSDPQIQQGLGLMGKAADAKLTPDIARELCQRTGSAAVLDGSIAQIGTQYSLILKAVNCSNGESLTSTEAQASDKSHVLEALGKAASEIRNKMGESLSTVRKFDTALEQATTPSLEALQAYSLGRKTREQKADAAAAVPLFQRAIRLDPNFAMAYAALGRSYVNLGARELAVENTTKAYELRDRGSERERFFIESAYYHSVTGDVKKARQSYELWAQTYPRDDSPVRSLGVIYSNLGVYEKALAATRESIRLEPGSGLNHSNLVSALLSLNRLEEARSAADGALAKNLDSSLLRLYLYRIAFLQNDSAGMAKQVAWGAGKPGVEESFLGLESNTAAFYGQIEKAREFSRQAVAAATRDGDKAAAAGTEANAALREALLGNRAEARQRAAAALALSTGRDGQFEVALGLTLAGDIVWPRRFAQDFAKLSPEDTLVQFAFLPVLRAQLALSGNQAQKAIEFLQMAAPYESGEASALYPAFLRGQAYLAAHQGGEAAAEFQKILDHPGIVLNEPIGALAHLQIGRAYAMQGDSAKARTAYQDFLALWKDADRDIPILITAKAEYAKLK